MVVVVVDIFNICCYCLLPKINKHIIDDSNEMLSKISQTESVLSSIFISNRPSSVRCPCINV